MWVAGCAGAAEEGVQARQGLQGGALEGSGSALGHAVAVNPDRTLRKEALARGWDIRTFKNPEPLFQTRDVSIGAGVVAGIAAVTVGGWWLARRGKPGTA